MFSAILETEIGKLLCRKDKDFFKLDPKTTENPAAL